MPARNAVGLLYGAAIYALFHVVSLFTGEVLGYTALQSGLASLPVAAAIAVVLVAGPLLAGSGLLVLAEITPAGADTSAPSCPASSSSAPVSARHSSR